MLLKSFYEASIILIPKQGKDITHKHKLQANITDECRCKNPHQNEFNSILKRSYTMIKWDLFQGCKDGSVFTNQTIHHINKMKNKNHMSISIGTEKVFEKTQDPFMIKTLNKVGIEEMYLNRIKTIYDKLIVNIILNGEKLKAFTLRSGTRQGCPLLPLFIQHSIGSPSHSNQIRKRNKRNPNWKGRSKMVIAHDTENPKDATKKLLELINKFSKVLSSLLVGRVTISW